MDLELEISPRILGRQAAPLTHSFVRELTVEDLELLKLPRVHTPQQSLKRLTNRHHALARQIAEGLKPREAAAIMGYNVSYVEGVLGADPSFIELVEFYRQNLMRESRSNFDRLVELTGDASDVLLDRLENEPEKISTPQLMELVKLGADRTGLGPQSSTTTVSINANIAERMKAARESARLKDVTPPEAKAS